MSSPAWLALMCTMCSAELREAPWTPSPVSRRSFDSRSWSAVMVFRGRHGVLDADGNIEVDIEAYTQKLSVCKIAKWMLKDYSAPLCVGELET